MFLRYISREEKPLYSKVNNNINFKQLNFYTYSRDAIYDIMSQYRIDQDSEILVPNYICNTVIDTIMEFTKNVKFYAINEKLKFDCNEIVSMVNKQTKMIFFVDYFGVEACVDEELVKLLKANDVLILKDSAHAFLTLVKNNFKSSYTYDFLVSSIYKALALYAGAVSLGFKESKVNFVSNHIIRKRKIVYKTKHLLCFFGMSVFNRDGEKLSVVNDNYVFQKGANGYRKYTSRLAKIDFQNLIRRRDMLAIKFYDYLQKYSIFTKDEIIKSSLQVFPIWCSSMENRDKILKIMKQECVDAFTWATFHKLAVNEYLWSHIVLLPLDEKVLIIMKEKVQSV